MKNSKRGRGVRTLAAEAAKITKPIFGSHGFADGAVVKDWPTIVGAHLGAHSAPEQITYPQGRKNAGTLHLKIDNGALAIELQHLEPVLVERINGYFGFRAVDKLKITQGPVPERAEAPPLPPPISKESESALLSSLTDVEDSDLKRALENLGRAVYGRE